MTRRPLCLVCLLLMISMMAADLLGFPLVRGNPLPRDVISWIEEHPKSSVCGEVIKSTDSDFSQSIYLNDAYLIYGSKKISIENVRVFLKKKEDIPVGSYVRVSGILERVPGQRNPGEFDSRQYYACDHIYYFLKKAVVEKKSGSYSRYGQFLVNLKEHFSRILQETAGSEAGTFEAIVLGDKTDLDEATKLRYQMAGIVHMLAISGVKTLNLVSLREAEKPVNWAFLWLHKGKKYIIKRYF